jgi:MFS family permease
MAQLSAAERPPGALRRALVPLALAQFICSFAGSNMNVMINDISKDLDTTVQGVQIAITVFLLVMAALMIPGGKLTDRYGRKRCFTAGLVIYGIGALLSAAASCAARQAGRLPGRYALTPGQWTTPCHYDNVLSWRPVNSTGC